MLDEQADRASSTPTARSTALCPYLRRRLPAHLSGQGREDPLRRRPRRPGQPQPALRQGPLRLRLRPPPAPPDQAADPQAGVAKDADDQVDPGQSLHAFPRGDLGGGARRRGRGPASGSATATGAQGARRLRLGQGLERGGLSVPEAGAHRLRHQQCRSLHAALPRLVGRGADGGDRLGRGDGAVHRGARMPTSSSSSARTRP